MTTLRSFIDPDQQPAIGPTSFMTERNEHEVRCGICSRPIYVDEEAYRFATNELERSGDNPFRCDICEDDYEDAYEG